MARDAQRQADAAGIPNAFIRPQAPGRERACTGERTGAQQEISSLQGCFRPASF
jgi:hypothetical protein